MKFKGPKDFLKRNEITEVTPQLIAYAALQVPPLIPRIFCRLTIPHPPDIRWTLIHEGVGHHRWRIQSRPLLPPHHTDPFG